MTDLETALSTKVAPWTEIEYRCKDFWIFVDKFPVTRGHLLFVPTTQNIECLMACFEHAYKWGFNGVTENKWKAFNVGQNIGVEAGQTVMYPHVHMIPRRKGDMHDPTGGVRNVIPGQGNYRSAAYQNPAIDFE